MQTLPTAKRHLIAVALGIAAATTAAHADEADARQLVKAMSDYLGAQQRIAFDYDATLDVVTSEGEKFGLASSGVTTLERPDHLFATRTGGFANVEMLFDGTTLTLVGRNAGVFTRVAAPGSIDQLLDSLQTDYGLVMPAADLLLSAPYDVLMEGVVEAKDLGSGFVGGEECDHLAFRNADVDWQIWIARGKDPHPCRYVITAKTVPQAPQYTLDVRGWRTGDQVPAADFTFEPKGETEVDLAAIAAEVADLPPHFTKGETE